MILHQLLCVSCLRELEGYGANVGSNHTGRIADQECWSGEGLFWGLSTVIKFPVDTTHAPYSIIAAGINLSSQRILYPFSLVMEINGVNNISPGWVLSNSAYTIARNEEKFSLRRKAKNHAFYTGWKVIRMETISLCIVAREMLRSVGGKSIYKGDREMEGIGKNTLTEKSRKDGIRIYTDTIQRFALHGLLYRLEKCLKTSFNSDFVFKLQKLITSRDDAQKHYESLLSSLDTKRFVSIPPNPWDVDQSKNSSTFNDTLLLLEFSSSIQSQPYSHIFGPDLVQLLHRLIKLEMLFADSVAHSKSKDDYRGERTIPGYSEAHINYKKDKVVQKCYQNLQKIQGRVDTVISLLGSRSKL